MLVVGPARSSRSPAAYLATFPPQLSASLTSIDAHLAHRTYLVDERFTLADAALYCRLRGLWQVRGYLFITTLTNHYTPHPHNMRARKHHYPFYLCSASWAPLPLPTGPILPAGSKPRAITLPPSPRLARRTRSRGLVRGTHGPCPPQLRRRPFLRARSSPRLPRARPPLRLLLTLPRRRGRRRRRQRRMPKKPRRRPRRRQRKLAQRSALHSRGPGRASALCEGFPLSVQVAGILRGRRARWMC